MFDVLGNNHQSLQGIKLLSNHLSLGAFVSQQLLFEPAERDV
jgi:hypothetical protein